MTKIPFFHEVVVMSFECLHCGNRNNEIQSAGPVQSQGARIELKVTKNVRNLSNTHYLVFKGIAHQ